MRVRWTSSWRRSQPRTTLNSHLHCLGTKWRSHAYGCRSLCCDAPVRFTAWPMQERREPLRSFRQAAMKQPTKPLTAKRRREREADRRVPSDLEKDERQPICALGRPSKRRVARGPRPARRSTCLSFPSTKPPLESRTPLLLASTDFPSNPARPCPKSLERRRAGRDEQGGKRARPCCCSLLTLIPSSLFSCRPQAVPQGPSASPTRSPTSPSVSSTLFI